MGIVLGIVIAVLWIIPMWKICAKVGFSPWFSLLAIIPLLGYVIVLGRLAYGQWPALAIRRG